MNISRSQASIPDLIAEVGNDLTPAERRIAREVLDEPTLLAFGTVSDLASRVGTSRPTIVRFANKLGFDGYSPLQRHVRIALSHELARPSERIRRADRAGPVARMAIDDALNTVFDVVNSQGMGELTAPLVQARRVWVLSGETSRAGAHAFHSGLSMVRPGVRPLEEHSIGTDQSDAGADDALVVFDFFRYRRQVTAAAGIFSESNASVVAITDSPLSPLVELADAWCEIEVPAIGPFDSSVPAVAMAELLVARVAKDLQQEAAARIDRIEALWEEAEVFL